MAETAPCRRCDSQISVEVERCPECGYEPGRSLISKLTAMLSVPVLAVSLLGVGVTGYALVTGTMSILTAGIGLVLSVLIGLAAVRVILNWYRQGKRKPTDRLIDLSE